MKTAVYGVFLEDEKIFEGTISEVAEAFNIAPASVYTYTSAKFKRLKGKFEMKRVGEVEIKRGEVRKPKNKPINDDDPFDSDSIIFHMLNDGNTVCSEKHFPQVAELLRAHGIDFKASKKSNWMREIDGLKKARVRESGYHYILERI